MTIAKRGVRVAVVALLSVPWPAQALTDEEIAESDRLLQAGEFQSAEALYRQAFERDPADAQAALRLIYSLIVQAKTAEATAYMDLMIDRGYEFLAEYVGRWGLHSHDPLLVVQAVVAIGDREQRNMAVSSAAGAWAAANASAAEGWALTLPMGEARDAALAGIARGLANGGQAPTQALLSAFSSDTARGQRLMFAFMELARHDAALAREMIDTYITDPVMRERADRLYETAINLPQP